MYLRRARSLLPRLARLSLTAASSAVPAAAALMPDARLEPPYAGAKEMLLVEQVDDPAFLQRLMEAVYPELPEPKKKKPRNCSE